jgi:hypothetical protein
MVTAMSPRHELIVRIIVILWFPILCLGFPDAGFWFLCPDFSSLVLDNDFGKKTGFRHMIVMRNYKQLAKE